MSEEIEVPCDICKGVFYTEKHPLMDLMDNIVGICEDCHEGYVNGNSIPASHNSSHNNRLNDLL